MLQLTSIISSMHYESNIRRVRKIAKRFVMSVRLSVRLHGTTRLTLDGFSRRFKFEHYLKIFWENSSLIKIWQKKRVLYVNTIVYVWSYLAQLLLEWEMFQRSDVEKVETHILYSIYFFRKSCCLWDNVEEDFRAGQATDGNMVHGHCV